MKIIDIAMASYNGERFIEEQILSIQRQTYSLWNLYISDDGSSDQTIEIIKKIAKYDQRIKLINTERQGGVIANFNKVLMSTYANYIVLSDQDDIWPEGRLEILVTEIQKYEDANPEKGILVYTDLELIDQDGMTIAESFYKLNKLNPLENLYGFNLLWISSVYGCTTIMNRNLLDLALPIPDNVQMHDQWLALKAKQNNGLFYLDEKTIKYRQHDNNVVGGHSTTFFSRIKNSKKIFKNIYNNSQSAIYFLKILNFSNKNNTKYLWIFAIREILPKVFYGSKKLYSFLFLFIFLSLI